MDPTSEVVTSTVNRILRHSTYRYMMIQKFLSRPGEHHVHILTWKLAFFWFRCVFLLLTNGRLPIQNEDKTDSNFHDQLSTTRKTFSG